MDLKDTIIKQLAAPVKRKGTQDYMTDEEGNIVTREEQQQFADEYMTAIATEIVSKTSDEELAAME